MSGDHFHAHIEKVDIVEKKDSQGVVKKVSHTLEESCRTEYTFDGDNKGLEGMMGFRDAKGDLYLLGLCEGNHCSDGAEGRDAGNGRMIVMKRDFTGVSYPRGPFYAPGGPCTTDLSSSLLCVG